MPVKFTEETLLDTPLVQAAILIYDIVALEGTDKVRCVSQIIQIVKRSLRESGDARAAARIIVEKFCTDAGEYKEKIGKIAELIKANHKIFVER
jgi:hypothetical protein